MPQLEPNLAGLAWFGLLWGVCCIGFLQLAGMYPLRGRAVLPVTMTTIVWVMLLAGTLAFALAELRWTTVVVVGGVLFLFLPGLFQALPEWWRDGRAGLRLSCCAMIAALALLVRVAAPSFPTWLI
ncbi:hypothetical protein ABIF38_007725 [Bradyrhizobium japonicum]|jgi:hypothetical protein|uniref:hypothetical protein n=1 Tax=Bradyrhizobium TaxID=374 RepID=UPI00035D0C46|nr:MULTISPECIES: hypothetical protein [Bradyrhizobium]MCP1729960.1 hypothetical protein [Bradyrhizobium elkanii]MCP1930415.1 hypothetical protein [Bradyrhizobium elkanii]MCS3481326.1 hypothetical protein [Bradyrhizobium elkanii]MCS3518171.1 hypothetical protein [Bradyrhizobium elkanii]MCS3574089.1 hypothetical protein [Bradyrhizobium elkanii]